MTVNVDQEGESEPVVRIFPHSVMMAKVHFDGEVYEENPTPSECE